MRLRLPRRHSRASTRAPRKRASPPRNPSTLRRGPCARTSTGRTRASSGSRTRGRPPRRTRRARPLRAPNSRSCSDTHPIRSDRSSRRRRRVGRRRPGTPSGCTRPGPRRRAAPAASGCRSCPGTPRFHRKHPRTPSRRGIRSRARRRASRHSSVRTDKPRRHSSALRRSSRRQGRSSRRCRRAPRRITPGHQCCSPRAGG